MIDLRSDTVTRPTKAMQQAMLNAPLGDDVFGEDPSINALEEKVADMFGHEAALFCPSGTMTNQIAIKTHTKPGQEVICHPTAHIYNYEGGGIAFNSGCQVRTADGGRGIMDLENIKAALQSDDIHQAKTALLVAENTANKGGGSCYELSALAEMKTWATNHNVKFHLDGARIWNALVFKGYKTHEVGTQFDSISVCFSKGLGCPVGSALTGDKNFVKEARYYRKKMGGGMRQAGILAAAANFALDHHFDRLQEDHVKAKELESALAHCHLVLSINPVETNIVIFNTKDVESADRFMSIMQQHGILMVKMGTTTLRFVTHLDVSNEQIKKVTETINHLS